MAAIDTLINHLEIDIKRTKDGGMKLLGPIEYRRILGEYERFLYRARWHKDRYVET